MMGKELVVNTGAADALAPILSTAKPKGALLYLTEYMGFPGFLPAGIMKRFQSLPESECYQSLFNIPYHLYTHVQWYRVGLWQPMASGTHQFQC